MLKAENGLLAKYLIISSILCLNINISAGEPAGDEDGLILSVSALYERDDNILRDSEVILDAYRLLLSPTIGWRWGDNSKDFSLSLSNQTAKYEEFSEDNYSDTTVNFNGQLRLNSRNQFQITAEYGDLTEARGAGFSLGNGANIQENDTFSQSQAGVVYTYGRDAAVAQVDFFMNQLTVDYDARFSLDNEDITAVRDREDVSYGLEFSYEIGPKTDLVLNATELDSSYDIETGFGNKITSTQIGVNWQATAKTSGRVLIGQQKRDFLAGEDTDDGIWTIAVDWAPRTYSTVSLESQKRGESSVGIGNSRDVESTTLTWNHQWTNFLGSTVEYSQQNTDFTDTIIYMDETIMSLGLEYIFSTNMLVSLYFQSSDRDSNDPEGRLNYDRNIYGLNFTFFYE
jgi:hypothetical protein